MLISNESPQYYEFAKAHIASVPWPEVRIWVVRRKDAALSEEYRQRLLDLVLASPTSEGKLSAARWYGRQGRLTEAEDAYYDALKNGLFFDALDATDELLKSERYRAEAVRGLIDVIRDPRPFPPRAAMSLLRLYHAEDELQPLVDAYVENPKNERLRTALVKRLRLLVEQDFRTQHKDPRDSDGTRVCQSVSRLRPGQPNPPGNNPPRARRPGGGTRYNEIVPLIAARRGTIERAILQTERRRQNEPSAEP